MKKAEFILFFTIFVVTGSSQVRRQQTSFGPEVDIERPAGVPTYFATLLSRNDRQMLMRCQHDKEMSYLHKDSVLGHFTGSLLDVRNPKGIMTLLIVQSNSACFNGAHNSRFWILAKQKSKTAERYKKIFEGQADGLDVAAKTRLRYPNLEVFSHTAVEGYTSTIKYLQGKYRTTSCYVQALGDEESKRRKVRCEKYNWEFRK